MGAKVSAETVKALRLFDKGATVGEASRKAGIETSTLRRALAKRGANAMALDAVASLSASKDAPQ